MRTAAQLSGFARAARAILEREKDLAQFEVYCASAEHRVARLVYTSDIRCRGVEELKSHVADGFTVRIAMRRDPHETGTATEAGDFGLEALRAALGRARRALLVDPHFPGLPADSRRLKPAAAHNRSNDLMRVGDSVLAAAAWRVVGGAIDAFAPHAGGGGASPGLVLGGDVSVMRDRMAIAGSNFDDVRADAGAHFTCTVTALIESSGGKGTASATGETAVEMRGVAARAGCVAVTRALALGGGERPSTGLYSVVLGPQPVAEILSYMVIPSLTTGAFHAASTAYHGRFGQCVMDSRLSLYDDPAARRGAFHRRLTCEGLTARRTRLIGGGHLVGLLSNFYDGHLLASDPNRGEKLGPLAGDRIRFASGSGYRLGESAMRRFDAVPGSAPTNVVMRTAGGVSTRELIRSVRDGIYVGRLWYTYPINGQRAGDFTCTISGDSYLIRNGELAAPLAPNALRINANIEQVFAHPVAVGNRLHPALVWGAPEAYYVPCLAARRLPLAAIEPPSS